MAREFSCAHCGMPENRQAPRECECGQLLCSDCDDDFVENGECPNNLTCAREARVVAE